MNTIKEAWESFSKVAIHEKADPRQFTDMRAAYYMGASRVMQILAELNDPKYSSAAVDAILDSLDEEIATEAIDIAAKIVERRFDSFMASLQAAVSTKN